MTPTHTVRTLALATLPWLLAACAAERQATPTAPVNASIAATGIVYVVPGGTGDGSSWATATNLTDAIANATPGIEIWVKRGTHVPRSATTDARAATFTLKNGVAIYGGFAGTETDKAQRPADLAANPTILTGDLAGNDVESFSDAGAPQFSEAMHGDNVYHVVSGKDNDASAVLDGVTITGGVCRDYGTSAPSTDARGGGVFLDGSSPTLSNLVIRYNTCGFGGGMDLVSNASPQMRNVTVRQNRASQGGGMMLEYNSVPTITASLIELNFGGLGGGIRTSSARLTMTNSTIRDNVSPNGAGVYLSDGGTASTVRSTFTNVRITGNHAGSRAAGSEGGQGLGVYMFDANAEFTSVVVAGNVGASSAGLAIIRAFAILTNTTVTGNRCVATGCGMLASAATVNVRNSIIAGNGSDVGISSAAFNATYSIVPAAFTGTGNKTDDPKFVRAVPTLPAVGPAGDVGDQRLQRGSPAVNAGTNDVTDPALPATDLDGTARIKGGTVDMGAYEQQPDATAPSASPTASPAPNGAGWNRSDVTVTWNWTDTESGIDATKCTTSSVVSTEGAAVQATATCTDKAGNTGSASYTVKLDKTAPTAGGTVSPNPVLKNLTATATSAATDALSGIASQSCGTPVTNTVGSFSVTCTATDRAGNTGTGQAAYTVISASTGVDNLIGQVRALRLGNLETPLVAKLNSARSNLAANRPSAAIADLNDFINQVNAKRGKGIQPADADALIASARLIIQSIQGGI